MRRLFATLMLLLYVCLGCVRVKPWQRENHASRAMQNENEELDAKLDGHIEEYREGSIGGAGVGGGGCGCN